MFVPPTWFDGMMFYIVYALIAMFVIPFIIGAIIGKLSEFEIGATAFFIFLIIGFIVTAVAAPIAWHDQYEIPSVTEKVITVKEWVPAPGANMSNINNADDLMLVTTKDEGFINKESDWIAGFSKWDTRDILFQLKPGGTYKIKYYGWREGKTSSYPNILEVTKVINETNAKNVTNDDYFGINIRGGGVIN